MVPFFGGTGTGVLNGFEPSPIRDTSLVLAGSDSDFNARHISERVPTTGGENPPNKQSHGGGSLVLREYPQGVYRVYPLSWVFSPQGVFSGMSLNKSIWTNYDYSLPSGNLT